MSLSPTPDSILTIKMITPLVGEALAYCVQQAVEDNFPGCVTYRASTDTLTYHKEITSLDSDLFDLLKGVKEIWIEVAAGADS